LKLNPAEKYRYLFKDAEKLTLVNPENKCEVDQIGFFDLKLQCKNSEKLLLVK